MNKNAVKFMREREDWESLFLYLYSNNEYDSIIDLYNELKEKGKQPKGFVEMFVQDAYKYKDNPDLRFQPEEF